MVRASRLRTMMRCTARAWCAIIAPCNVSRNGLRQSGAERPNASNTSWPAPGSSPGGVPAIHSTGHTPTGLAEKDARIKSGHNDVRKGAGQKERGPTLLVRPRPCSAHTSASDERDPSVVSDTRVRDIPNKSRFSRLIPLRPTESRVSHLIPLCLGESRLSRLIPPCPGESQLIPHAIVLTRLTARLRAALRCLSGAVPPWR